MDDWSLPFEESMLDRGNVIIWCPDPDLVGELFELFKAHDIRWAGGEPMSYTGWDDSDVDTCYRVTDEGRLKRGNTDYYSEYNYYGHIKCQFYGVGPDIEISDADFETVISAGGVVKGGRTHVG